MGWTISHGNSQRGKNYRSAGAMHDVGQQVAHIVTAKEWRTVEKLFKLANSGDGPFTIPHREAGKMAAVLRKAASHPLMPRSFVGDSLVSADAVRELADAAQRAATVRQSWEWH
ncbi:hypothetical protein ACIP69_18400 [Streptomyces hygroscopicus]|uniref:DUF7739 domain-containing protein n=1 Tax=Streptomyces hygroscopicus TaxID=1912 RepID=UPI0037F177F9